MLSRDPKTRLTAAQCLEHEFFKVIPKPSNVHKKAFFQQTKNLTQEFVEEKCDYKGSFITNDMVKYPQMPKLDLKFNTTDFE